MYNKFEKGDTFYNLFKGDAAIWAENVRKFRITTSQLTSLLTSPVTLVQAVPGYALFPTMLVMNKPAGGNCTVVGVTGLGVFFRGGSVIAMGYNNAALPANLFASTGNALTYFTGPGSSAGTLYAAFSTVNPAGDQYGNRDLVFTTTGASPVVSAGSPTLTLLLAWRQIPLTIPLS